jgi:hypothetical protein
VTGCVFIPAGWLVAAGMGFRTHGIATDTLMPPSTHAPAAKSRPDQSAEEPQ